MIIVTPRVMKPEAGQKRGQLLAMYRRNMPISVMMRARAKQPVIRWVMASKKKNLETWKVLTSIPKLAATMAMSAMILQTRMMLRTTYPGPDRERLKNGIL